MKTIDQDIAEETAAMDARFDRLQPEMIAAFRAHGATDQDMPECLAFAHAEYWCQSRALLERLRATLVRLESC